MSNLKRLIRREINRQREVKIGTVLTEPKLVDFDGMGIGLWCIDVHFGGEDYLRNVPVKAVHSRFFAQVGQTVALRKGAQGRWEAVGPGDRAIGSMVAKTYDLETRTEQTTGSIGFYSERVGLQYYSTLDGTSPTGIIFGDGVTHFGLIRIIDASTGLPV